MDILRAAKPPADLTRAHKIARFEKVWGEEQWLVNTGAYCGKRMLLKKGFQCSLHHHKIKDETFMVQSGKVRFELGDEIFVMYPGDVVRVKTGTKHRFGGLEPSVMIEFSTHHDDDDTYRDEGENSRYNPDLLQRPE